MTGKLNFYKKIKSEDQVKEFCSLVLDFQDDSLQRAFDFVPVFTTYSENNNNFGFIRFGIDYFDIKEILINSFTHVGKSFAFLIDTISHELAHIYIQEHNKNHKKITNAFKVIIKYYYSLYYENKNQDKKVA